MIFDVFETQVMNLTPHEIFFHAPGQTGTDKDGNEVKDAIVVPPSGETANAKPQAEYDVCGGYKCW